MENLFFNYLNENDKIKVYKIDNHEILGASQQIEIISNIMLNLVDENFDLNCTKLVEVINSFVNHFIESRGNASRAFINSLRELTRNVNNDVDNYEDLKRLISNNIKEFKLSAKKNLKKILEYSNNELSAYTDIFLYDYSSTVEKAVLYISEENDRNINIYISESSAIDGGSPFLKLNDKKNLKIHFFPDSAALYFLKKSQCCLMGAETFYPDGTGFNTVGSDIMGHLCKIFDKKLYFLTPMNKLDERRNVGIRKEIVSIDYKDKYKNNDILDESIFTIIPELIGVNPDNIYAYITEFGVIPTNSMYLISREYMTRLGGKYE